MLLFYLPNGWLTSQTSGSAVNTVYTLNQQQQVIDLTNSKPGLPSTIFSEFGSILYDPAGNHTSHTESFPNRPALNGTVTYNYDNKDQLTSEVNTAAAPNGFSISYGLDNFGNIVIGGAATYNSADQLTSGMAHHDLAGNQDQLPDTSLVPATYDSTNHMTSIGTSAFSMGYYADGSRMWKKTSPASNPTYYLYCDSTIPECEFDSSGHVTTFHTSGPNGLLASSAPSGGSWASTYYAFDFRGNRANLLENLGTAHEPDF